MRTQLRIVAGSLRGRKVHCTVSPALRPAPQMVREALFSILGRGVPGQPFYDLFAGTGAMGMEALSRGAAPVVFVERDFRTAREIEENLRRFGVRERADVVRADVYRWAERWPGAETAVNFFLGPPFPDFQDRLDELLGTVAGLQARIAPGSVLVVQTEQGGPLERIPDLEQWDVRRYGRNVLLIWVKGDVGSPSTP